MSMPNRIVNGQMDPLTFSRFIGRTLVVRECWIWTGHLTREGYGVMCVGQKRAAAHRIAYGHFVGPIPDDLVLDHLCRNRSCVNPKHLEAVTNAENVDRGVGITAMQSRQTHCKRGHEFTEDNTYGWASGKRVCKACHRAKVAARGGHLDSDAVLRRKGERMDCPQCGKTVRRDSLRRHARLIHEGGVLVDVAREFGVDS